MNFTQQISLRKIAVLISAFCVLSEAPFAFANDPAKGSGHRAIASVRATKKSKRGSQPATFVASMAPTVMPKAIGKRATQARLHKIEIQGQTVYVSETTGPSGRMKILVRVGPNLQEIRLDNDDDGIADLWELEKGGVVTRFTQPGRSGFEMLTIEKQIPQGLLVSEFKLNQKSNDYRFVEARIKPLAKMFAASKAGEAAKTNKSKAKPQPKTPSASYASKVILSRICDAKKDSSEDSDSSETGALPCVPPEVQQNADDYLANIAALESSENSSGNPISDAVACKLNRLRGLFFEKSCFDVNDPEANQKMVNSFDDIKKGIARVMAAPVEDRGKAEDHFMACLESNDLSYYSAKMQERFLKQLLDADMLVDEYLPADERQAAKNGPSCEPILKLERTDSKFIAPFKCDFKEPIVSKNKKVMMQRGEYQPYNKQISFNLSSEFMPASLDGTARIGGTGQYIQSADIAYSWTFFHEMLHASGLCSQNGSEDEQIVHALEKCCSPYSSGKTAVGGPGSPCDGVRQFVALAKSKQGKPDQLITSSTSGYSARPAAITPTAPQISEAATNYTIWIKKNDEYNVGLGTVFNDKQRQTQIALTSYFNYLGKRFDADQAYFAKCVSQSKLGGSAAQEDCGKKYGKGRLKQHTNTFITNICPALFAPPSGQSRVTTASRSASAGAVTQNLPPEQNAFCLSLAKPLLALAAPKIDGKENGCLYAAIFSDTGVECKTPVELSYEDVEKAKEVTPHLAIGEPPVTDGATTIALYRIAGQYDVNPPTSSPAPTQAPSLAPAPPVAQAPPPPQVAQAPSVAPAPATQAPSVAPAPAAQAPPPAAPAAAAPVPSLPGAIAENAPLNPAIGESPPAREERRENKFQEIGRPEGQTAQYFNGLKDFLKSTSQDNQPLGSERPTSASRIYDGLRNLLRPVSTADAGQPGSALENLGQKLRTLRIPNPTTRDPASVAGTPIGKIDDGPPQSSANVRTLDERPADKPEDRTDQVQAAEKAAGGRKPGPQGSARDGDPNGSLSGATPSNGSNGKKPPGKPTASSLRISLADPNESPDRKPSEFNGCDFVSILKDKDYSGVTKPWLHDKDVNDRLKACGKYRVRDDEGRWYGPTSQRKNQETKAEIIELIYCQRFKHLSTQVECVTGVEDD